MSGILKPLSFPLLLSSVQRNAELPNPNLDLDIPYAPPMTIHPERNTGVWMSRWMFELIRRDEEPQRPVFVQDIPNLGVELSACEKWCGEG